jgi:hypothetical protein
MQHGQKTDLRREEPWIGCDLQQSLGDGAE